MKEIFEKSILKLCNEECNSITAVAILYENSPNKNNIMKGEAVVTALKNMNDSQLYEEEEIKGIYFPDHNRGEFFYTTQKVLSASEVSKKLDSDLCDKSVRVSIAFDPATNTFLRLVTGLTIEKINVEMEMNIKIFRYWGGVA